MLVELAVENYAVIEAVRVRFHAGLNLLTGETGSGKSIVVDAVGLLLGGRAASEMVRAGTDRARISGIFEVAGSPALTALLDAAGIEIEDGEVLVEREIQASGKSRAFIGNRPATVQLLRDLAPHLADIHGQHDQQQLFSSAVQSEMLDVFAQAEPLVAQVGEAFEAWKQIVAELEKLERTSQEKLRLADLWQHQRAEIEAISPTPVEDTELDAERRVLRNVVRLQELADQAMNSLYEDAGSASSQLSLAAKRLEDLAHIDESAREIQATLEPAIAAIDDAAHALRTYIGKLEADPGRLEEVENRLAAIEKLKRKYGSSIDQILTFLEEVRRELAAVENSDDRRTALQKQSTTFAATYTDLAKQLTAKRTEAALQLSKKVEQELASLAMEKTRVEIRVSPVEWSASGCDHVQFLIAPNQGEELKPLEKVASGGELSRVALALKTCTTTAPGARKPTAKAAAAQRTLVFDEVDAGVGGSAAESVGKRLKRLSVSNQVLCVTHLPQIAGFADHHYYVEKHSDHGRTVASIVELTGQARTREIGRMLSGELITPEALRHAEKLLKTAAS
ncbi:MAG: DNA repair protein RecN [Acidobacteriota bacterium]